MLLIVNVTFYRKRHIIIYLTTLLLDVEIIFYFSLYNVMGIFMQKSIFCIRITSSVYWIFFKALLHIAKLLFQRGCTQLH